MNSNNVELLILLADLKTAYDKVDVIKDNVIKTAREDLYYKDVFDNAVDIYKTYTKRDRQRVGIILSVVYQVGESKKVDGFEKLSVGDVHVEFREIVDMNVRPGFVLYNPEGGQCNLIVDILSGEDF